MADTTFLPEPQYPDDLDPAAALDVLDKRLVDPTAAPPDLIVTDDALPPYGRGWAFDFSINRLVVQSGGGVSQTYGLQTLRTWVEKCLRTDRGAHPIYSDEFGMVRPFDMIGQQLTDVSSEDLQERITDALTKHPSIVDVQGFSMTYSTDGDDLLSVSFVAVLADQQALVVDSLQLT